MKLQVISDIHTEFVYRRGGEQALEQLFEGLFSPEADHVVIAGDMSNSSLLDKSFDIALKYCNDIIYVPGNHDYYGASFKTMDSYFSSLSKPRLFVLNRDTVELGNRTFVGATGWFPRSDNGRFYKDYLNDFVKIADGTFNTITRRHVQDRKFLEDNVDNRTIVITHHLPVYQCVAPMYDGNPTNCYFVSYFEDILKKNTPYLWIHGHTHMPVDLQYVTTPIRAAPFGYWQVERFTIPEPCLIDV